MGAAASTVFSAALHSPPPFADFVSEGQLLLAHMKLPPHTLAALPAFVYFSGVHTLVLDGERGSEGVGCEHACSGDALLRVGFI